MNGSLTDRQQRRLFILDDSKTFLSYAQQLLRVAGYVVHAFETHLGITREVIRHTPDLLLVDQNMPTVTGDKVCRMLRTLPQGKKLLIILHSTTPKEELHEIAERCGADGFIVKSQNPKDLLSGVDRFLLGGQNRTQYGGGGR